MSITKFYIPTHFIIGRGSLSQLGKEATKIGKTALLVTGSHSMRKTGILDRVIADLQASSIRTIVFDKVESNPRASTVDEGAVVARDNVVDMVIGLGGGSAMDASKCIALTARGTDPFFSYVRRKAVSNPISLPIIAIPTVAASGSEANNGAVITDWDTHEKVSFSHPTIYPTCSIVDPTLTLTLPAKPTAQGGVDIFCHLVENYITAHKSTLINDSLRESSMKTVVQALPAVLKKLDDINEREKLSWASTIACSQFTSLGGGTGSMTLHGIEHPLSGEYDIAHGDGLACLLIAWMEHTYEDRKERLTQLGERVFGMPDGIAATAKWLKQVGMDHRLRHLGVKEADFTKLADNAVRTAPWLKLHPTPLDVESVISIYKKSY